MEFLREFILPVVYAVVASGAFAVLYRVRGVEVFFSSLGGGLGWAVYLIIVHSLRRDNDVAAYLFAALSIAIFSELMAILRRRPALLYNTIAIFPIVPGAAILRTMEYLLRGDTQAFTEQGLYSLQVSGAIAIGILVGSSAVRIIRKALRVWKCRRTAL